MGDPTIHRQVQPTWRIHTAVHFDLDAAHTITHTEQQMFDQIYLRLPAPAVVHIHPHALSHVHFIVYFLINTNTHTSSHTTRRV